MQNDYFLEPSRYLCMSWGLLVWLLMRIGSGENNEHEHIMYYTEHCRKCTTLPHDDQWTSPTKKNNW